MISYKISCLAIGVFVLLVLQASPTHQIKCWDCDSWTDKNCGQPFNNRTIQVTDCSLMADRHMQKCRKIIQKIVNNGMKYTRGCLIDDHTSEQLSEASIELCSTDGCNSAPVKTPFCFIVLLSPIFFGFYLLR